MSTNENADHKSHSNDPAVFKTRAFIINTNPWYSAVSAYSFELAQFMARTQKHFIFFSPRHSPLGDRIQKAALPFAGFELRARPTLFSLLVFALDFLRFLLLWLKLKPQYIFVFEGREHTLAGLSRLVLFPLLRYTKIVRIRGQAKKVTNNFFSRFSYRYLSQSVVFCASVVQKRMAVHVTNAQVQLFCTDPPPPLPALNHHSFPLPPLDFSLPVFAIVGRFDPVKGHRELFEELARTNPADNKVTLQVLCIGEQRNLCINDLLFSINQAWSAWGPVQVHKESHAHGESALIHAAEGKMRVFLYEGYLATLPQLLTKVHAGIIPSLDSEVICRVAVEFLQAGVPVLCAEVGALPEVAAQVQFFCQTGMREIQGTHTNPQNSLGQGRRGRVSDVYTRCTQVSDDEPNDARPHFQDWYKAPIEVVAPGQWATAIARATATALSPDFHVVRALAKEAGIGCFGSHHYQTFFREKNNGPQ